MEDIDRRQFFKQVGMVSGGVSTLLMLERLPVKLVG